MARRWPVLAVEADVVEPVVLVELADEELWLPQAGSTKATVSAAAAVTNRLEGTGQP